MNQAVIAYKLKGMRISSIRKTEGNCSKFSKWKESHSLQNCRFSLLFSTGDILRRGMSAIQRQKFQTDDVNQCLHNISGSPGVPHPNLFNFTFLLVDFTKVLRSSANKSQKNSTASSREEYIPPILTVL